MSGGRVRWGNVVVTGLVGVVVYLVVFVALAVARPAGEALGLFDAGPLRPFYLVEVLRAAVVSLVGLVALRNRQEGRGRGRDGVPVPGPWDPVGVSEGAAPSFFLVHALLYAAIAVVVICGGDLVLSGLSADTLLEAAALVAGSLLAVPLVRGLGARRV
ncbi:hypothetical protein D4740_06925 [Actinomyces sp. 2119]|uniref:Uncharacterized protein n=1 Tax=Actinomyces lilanjuaniae TaxID=2321394 RepID=A0ABM6Z1B3_9ACTO|nr:MULTISPECIES: hypothetical protein [Actinomyces]AYD89037.1 hypothetical protein D5R93_01340 [Actinomyces lilanjuaniae]RJF40520.1 hypothetical protein D4740_11810 [Actinomyces sp. 2119]RJF41819.1 hypothetical protein D4740_06925 [Actinomyces sp. 2119]